jgi:hypothetical protein
VVKFIIFNKNYKETWRGRRVVMLNPVSLETALLPAGPQHFTAVLIEAVLVLVPDNQYAFGGLYSARTVHVIRNV